PAKAATAAANSGAGTRPPASPDHSTPAPRPLTPPERGLLARFPQPALELAIRLFQVAQARFQLARALVQAVQLHPLVEPVAHDGEDVVVVPRLLEILEDADLVDAADGVLLVGISGEQHEGALGIETAHLEQ